ncbi:phosphate starvation protein [Weissella confusa]|uniref:Protein PsiE n=1 Tax=Weissella fermenti TaxID=2987699 RepID=A0ABT6D470_9LACO|nr:MULTISPECIES: phosphate-starvation-inducible PsiE family protein [Weissella]MBJ7688978.1 phosphate starvation protein [Weissella confusa]MCW0926131.1 phosphate-starvation-inducible PsiE family protein [Weissella sp. LMG 11983]MDF9300320.1 phosphate-starvation-inducible PsiE family protein [Weissella sp. BK2]
MNRKIIEKGYAIILDLAMLVLGIVMIGFFLKELWELVTMLMHVDLATDFFGVAERILETFLFFEFVVLTREYFIQDRISLQNFMYIGITALLRNLLVYHADTIGILIQAAAIAILILVLVVYRWSRRYLADLAHREEREEMVFAEEHPDATK